MKIKGMYGNKVMVDFFQSIRTDGLNAIATLNSLSDINVRNKNNANLLHTAIAHKNVDVARELIRREIELNAQDSDGRTPLHYACIYNLPDIVQLMLEIGANIELTDKHGNTALWAAVFESNGNYDVVNLLLEHGALHLAELKNKHGRSPLDFANQIGDAELKKLLTVVE